MDSVFLLLGSNMGDRLSNLHRAFEEIKTGNMGEVGQYSKIYETESWGIEELPAHLNQVLILNTSCTPQEVLSKTQEIEIKLGRIRHEHWGSRVIDIDILYYGQTVMNTPNLIIPHPLLQFRRFVLTPLTEIAPDLVHPVLKKTNREMLHTLSDPLKVEVYRYS